jgi:hypothetical protein
MGYLDLYEGLANSLQIFIIVPEIRPIAPQEGETEVTGQAYCSVAHVCWPRKPKSKEAVDSPLMIWKKNVLPCNSPVQIPAFLGTEHEVVVLEGHTEIVKVGILLGWDMAFPEAFRNLRLKGADLIIGLTNWDKETALMPSRRYDFVAHETLLADMTTSRPHENNCAVVVCRGDGFSEVRVPISGRIFRAPKDEGAHVVKIDLSLAKVANASYGFADILRSRESGSTSATTLVAASVSQKSSRSRSHSRNPVKLNKVSSRSRGRRCLRGFINSRLSRPSAVEILG